MLKSIKHCKLSNNWTSISSGMMIKYRCYHNPKYRLQELQPVEAPVVELNQDNVQVSSVVVPERAHSLFTRLVRLSDLDPQLKNIMGQYKSDWERYSNQMEKETAHRIFECSLRVQTYLRSSCDHKQEYDNRFLKVLDCELADECANLNKQLEKQIFSL